MKRRQQKTGVPSKRARQEEDEEVESIGSASEGEEQRGEAEDSDDDDFFEEETVDEKRIRLAKEYLKQTGMDEDSKETMGRLEKEADVKVNKFESSIAEELTWSAPTFYKGHLLSPTCVTITHDGTSAFSGGKDCAVVQWDLETGKKVILPGKRKEFDCGGHFEEVMDIQMCSEDNMFVSVGADRLVRVWDSRTPTGTVSKFRGHQKAITSVAVEPGSEHIFSGSRDKTIKMWSLKQQAYIESKMGHTEPMTCMDMLTKDKLVTGGEDKTVRRWKVEQDSHLLFSRHGASVDAVVTTSRDRFLSGSQDGSIMFWSDSCKKPIATVDRAHGGNWISALTAVRCTDVSFSGSMDGHIRIWGMSQTKKNAASMREIGAIECVGSVNQMAVSGNGGVLVAAVGKEHKHGRWYSERKAKNGLMVVRLKHTAPALS